MRAKPLLVEIGTEELPARGLAQLGASFAEHLHAALVEARLLAPGATPARWFATPRRLAVRLAEVRVRQPEQQIERRGPAVAAAFSEQGEATRAALGFAGSCGVEVTDLERLRTDKGEWLVFRHTQSGRSARELVGPCIEQALRHLPIRKRMRWGEGDAEFVRPVHWLVVLHGAAVIGAELLSVRAGRNSRGHRFHAPGPLPIAHADAYEATLEDAQVIADFAARRTRIRSQIVRLGRRHGGTVRLDDDLLDEVTALVEWPKALLGSFDAEFLELPAEVLISSMQDHQKYFPIGDDDGLQAHFVAVSNIRSTSPQRVRRGNERVLRARLADARFFWDTDRTIPLGERRETLAKVLFHHRLGTVLDKSRRVESLAGFIAERLQLEVEPCQRAAALAKADLVTDMVGEFPALQGVIGRYYALGDGESPAVAAAIATHYQPRFAGDALPAEPTGQVVAIADKLDTVVGLHAVGELPSGEKDPYALRRAALGVLRILIEREIDLDLRELITEAGRRYDQAGVAVGTEIEERVFDFMLERLRAYYSAAGFAADELAAVLECRPPRPLDFDLRLKAVARFRTMEPAHSLAAANKRIRNILRRAGDDIPDQVSDTLLIEIGEQQLAESLVSVASNVWPLVSGRRYTEALEVMAGFRGPIDRFFDEVLVMSDDEDLRGNRLALLSHVSRLFLSIADVSKLQEPGAPG